MVRARVVSHRRLKRFASTLTRSRPADSRRSSRTASVRLTPAIPLPQGRRFAFRDPQLQGHFVRRRARLQLAERSSRLDTGLRAHEPPDTLSRALPGSTSDPVGVPREQARQWITIWPRSGIRSRTSQIHRVQSRAHASWPTGIVSASSTLAIEASRKVLVSIPADCERSCLALSVARSCLSHAASSFTACRFRATWYAVSTTCAANSREGRASPCVSVQTLRGQFPQTSRHCRRL
jgi:hypothetical protein